MIDLCRANCLWATSFFRRCIIPATHCQANRGINAVGLRKLTKYCDSFRFLELFCVYFYWDGTSSPKSSINLINLSRSFIFVYLLNFDGQYELSITLDFDFSNSFFEYSTNQFISLSFNRTFRPVKIKLLHLFNVRY